ncbi:tectonic-3 [Discoglossus pictus]
MALVIVFVELLLLGATGGSQVRNAGTRASTGVAICSCDLSPGECDLNCCCDTDCALSDPTSVFSFCLPGSTKLQTSVCLYNWLIFRSNAPYSTELVSSSSPRTPVLFCVLPSDSSLNYFVTPQAVNVTTFSALRNTYGGASFIPPSESTPTFSNFYRAGDTILTVSTSSILGVLKQPAPLGAQSICSDSNPARFLFSNTTLCLRLISNVSESCTTDPSLSTSSYYENIGVLKVPADAQGTTVVNINSLITDSPVLQGDSCANVVSEVIYTVLYNGTRGITSVTVNFTLISLPSTSRSLQQSFKVIYKSSSAAVDTVQTRSGNPGYLVGYPVLTDSGSLTLVSSLGDGSCSHRPVQFGMNILSGCTIRGLASETCTNLHIRAYTLLAGSSPRSAAIIGNASVTQPGDWTSIIYQNCSAQDLGNCSTSCFIPVSLNVQILWAQVGLLSNPQSQIFGVRFLFSCRPVQCQDTTILQTKVSFTDITKKGPSPRSVPTVTGRAPLDFFYPFQTSIAVKGTTATIVPLLLLLLSFIQTT